METGMAMETGTEKEKGKGMDRCSYECGSMIRTTYKAWQTRVEIDTITVQSRWIASDREQWTVKIAVKAGERQRP
jgi:hypothetical protein